MQRGAGQPTGLSARRARRTKSTGLKGLKQEVGARRSPRLLVYNIILFNSSTAKKKNGFAKKYLNASIQGSWSAICYHNPTFAGLPPQQSFAAGSCSFTQNLEKCNIENQSTTNIWEFWVKESIVNHSKWVPMHCIAMWRSSHSWFSSIIKAALKF